MKKIQRDQKKSESHHPFFWIAGRIQTIPFPHFRQWMGFFGIFNSSDHDNVKRTREQERNF